MASETKTDPQDVRIYEVGYLLTPTISEGDINEEVARIKSAIEERGGIFISEDMPRIKTLAYPFSKLVGSKRDKFQQAYFGWIKFELPYKETTALTAALNENPHIIRFVLVKTVRESTLVSLKPTITRKTDMPKKGVMSEEEIEKSIEKLVSETEA